MCQVLKTIPAPFLWAFTLSELQYALGISAETLKRLQAMPDAPEPHKCGGGHCVPEWKEFVQSHRGSAFEALSPEGIAAENLRGMIREREEALQKEQAFYIFLGDAFSEIERHQQEELNVFQNQIVEQLPKRAAGKSSAEVRKLCKEANERFHTVFTQALNRPQQERPKCPCVSEISDLTKLRDRLQDVIQRTHEFRVACRRGHWVKIEHAAPILAEAMIGIRLTFDRITLESLPSEIEGKKENDAYIACTVAKRDFGAFSKSISDRLQENLRALPR